ncbi:MAG: ECF-type riboflavin transporter substrate-binding protein [Treponema sp.]|jgi:energy-coupling factor transport system substrate-specific component|nr:ECF-type riboflavin transporter substrate-binding protein [Treponema sp.]
MATKVISVKTVVAIGIGAAIMFVLMRFVAIPSGVPNTNLNLSAAIVSVFAAIFGPIAGLLIAFIGHTLTDLTWGGIWWSWVIADAVFGLIIGIFWKLFKIEEGGFGVKQAILFNVIQIVANAIAWVGVAPLLDILIYQEPSDKVFIQGLTAAGLNAAVVLILGTALALGYARTKVKAGSLKKEEDVENVEDQNIKNVSKFDGGLLSFIGWNILGCLLTVLTLGICYPWALCMVYRWKINHTVIKGKRLQFHGSAVSLFGHWILWLLLCIITLGIYSFWMFIALEKWKVKNTDFVED